MTRTPVIQKIQWHEGMLLSPQHFQQLELHNQQTLRYHLNSVSPFYWGVHHVKFDAIILASGVVRLLEIEAVMPDGLIVHQPMQSEVPLEIDMTEMKEELLKRELMIYLTVPERTMTGSPVIGEWPRYLSVDGPEVLDENTPDNVVRIPRLMPKVGLMVGAVPPARYESIPLARIAYKDEAYCLAPYTPPCFIIPKNSHVEERCIDLAMKMREKAAYLAEKWQTQIGTDLLGETTELLRPLAESLPLLEAIVTTGKAHPYDLYLTLCTIAGRLATLRLSQVIPTFPPYNHNEILKSFAPLLDWMERVLTSIERPYTIIPFLQNDRLFYHKLSRNWMPESILIGVRIPNGMDATEMKDWIRECVIATESHVETVRMKRVTGAHRDLIEGEELADLMPGSGLQLYRIQMDPHYIKSGETLMIFHAADHPSHRPVGIVLYIKGPHLYDDESTEQEG